MGRPLSTASPVALRFSTSDVSAFLSPNFSMLFMALRSLAGLLLKQYNRRLEQKEHKNKLIERLLEVYHIHHGNNDVEKMTLTSSCFPSVDDRTTLDIFI